MARRRFEPGHPSTTRRTPVERVLDTFALFFRCEATSGLVLLACTALAVAGANSPWAGDIARFWQRPFTIGLEDFQLSKPLLLWINDGLMAVFFFLVGLEIKREMRGGELASFRKALSPIIAAGAGMAVPAAVYLAFNHDGPSARGWGVPMATDIAFALCVVSLLGRRVPVTIKVFLTALAIVDDIGAVAVIAVFYTPGISLSALCSGLTALALAAVGNALGARRTRFYLVLGLVAWVGFLKSGVHPTVAGVLLAMCVPAGSGGAGKGCATPLQRMEHALAPWVAYGVMPLFALANAGVSFAGITPDALARPVTLGVCAGLLVGKLGGVFLSVWLLAKTGLAPLPLGANWRHILGLSLLAGIGFTMSLFIAQLAFLDPGQLAEAKLGIIGASLLAGVLGWAVLRRGGPAA